MVTVRLLANIFVVSAAVASTNVWTTKEENAAN